VGVERNEASDRDQPAPQGQRHSLRATLRAELVEQRVDVILDGRLADAEPGGDRLVGQPLGDQAQDFELTRRQALPQVIQAERLTRWWFEGRIRNREAFEDGCQRCPQRRTYAISFPGHGARGTGPGS